MRIKICFPWKSDQELFLHNVLAKFIKDEVIHGLTRVAVRSLYREVGKKRPGRLSRLAAGKIDSRKGSVLTRMITEHCQPGVLYAAKRPS